MKFNKWTLALAATGVVSLASTVQADEQHPVNTLLTSTTLYGYVDTAAIWNFDDGHTQAGRFANTGGSGSPTGDRQDGFNLNVVKLGLEKPLDEGTWSAGYKAELWFGPDAPALPGQLGNSDVALKQAYVALRVPIGNGLDFKVGQYDTIIGYETADSYTNPNFSRSFGFFLEPLGHTGILATYQFSEIFGVAGGIANTAFGKINTKDAVESVKTYMGGITLKAPESTGWLSGASLYAGVIDGGISSLQTGNNPQNDSLNLYVGASVPTPWKALTVGAAYDYLADAQFVDSYAQAFAAYVSFQATEQLKLNLRGEYANSSGFMFIAQNDESLWAATVTLDYALWANVVTRLEFRWDHSEHGTPFDGEEDDLSLAANIIYKF
jgi:hypothetical protein